MLRDLTGGLGINEPLIGAHLALPVSGYIGLPVPEDPLVLDALGDRGSYFFARRAAQAWEPALRDLIVARFAFDARRHEERTGSAPDLVLVKEPWGSRAAPVLRRALPRSRILFLARDGRDVVHSLLDGVSDGWLTTSFGVRVAGDAERRAYLVEAARQWVRNAEAVLVAYEAHDPARRLRSSYEDLRSDTAAEVRRILDWLGTADTSGVDDAVRTSAFTTVPEEGRGPGKFLRAASPGQWRVGLATDEQVAVEAVMRPMLTRLGYE
jgi:hypothetical protein